MAIDSGPVGRRELARRKAAAISGAVASPARMTESDGAGSWTTVRPLARSASCNRSRPYCAGPANPPRTTTAILPAANAGASGNARIAREIMIAGRYMDLAYLRRPAHGQGLGTAGQSLRRLPTITAKIVARNVANIPATMPLPCVARYPATPIPIIATNPPTHIDQRLVAEADLVCSIANSNWRPSIFSTWSMNVLERSAICSAEEGPVLAKDLNPSLVGGLPCRPLQAYSKSICRHVSATSITAAIISCWVSALMIFKKYACSPKWKNVTHVGFSART